jgi:ribosome-binding protein aMBF1 (putative translation factor)
MNNLKKCRERQHLSQVGLAVKARVAVGMVSAIERWNYVPGPTVRNRIAETLGVSLMELWPRLGDNDERTSGQDIQ